MKIGDVVIISEKLDEQYRSIIGKCGEIVANVHDQAPDHPFLVLLHTPMDSVMLSFDFIEDAIGRNVSDGEQQYYGIFSRDELKVIYREGRKE